MVRCNLDACSVLLLPAFPLCYQQVLNYRDAACCLQNATCYPCQTFCLGQLLPCRNMRVLLAALLGRCSPWIGHLGLASQAGPPWRRGASASRQASGRLSGTLDDPR